MAYTINYSSTAKGSITVEDSTINQTTSLDIPGRNTTGYGSVIGENLIKLLENFTNNSAPLRPTEGQLWYDNTVGVNTLKIYDGTNWVPAGQIKKGDDQPSAAQSLAGDLWSDTDNNQLYLFTGSGWILVGPEFSQGLLTGARPLSISGTDDVQYTVLEIQIGGSPFAIYSKDSFIPKSTIQGFATIQPGINLSTLDLGGDGVSKYYGTAEKADALVVNGIKVIANNFLRSDVDSTTNNALNITNNNGIKVGQDGTLNVGWEGTSGLINNQTSGSSIDFRVNNLGTPATVLRVDSTEKVGINTLSPTEALDVLGNITTSGTLAVRSTDDSSSIGTGAVRISGGVGIAKKLFVGNDTKIEGTITARSIQPDTTGTYSLGGDPANGGKTWANVYATNFVGNLIGNITGTVSGRSGSTNKLATPTTFQLTGDVSSPPLSFDGQTGGTTKQFASTISNTFIANKTEVATSNVDDEFIINRVSGSQGVFKISTRNLLRAVTGTTPIGTVSPYAGETAPDGWHLCDGTELLIASFQSLFTIIRYRFKDQSLVTSGYFAVPDLRGRFPLGRDNMGGSSANRVTNVSADTTGQSGGSEKKNIEVNNLPEHEHDLRGPSGDQYYTLRDVSGVPNDPAGIQYDAPTGTQAGQAFPTSGGILTTDSLGDPLDVMSPFTAMNYIIYTGVGG